VANNSQITNISKLIFMDEKWFLAMQEELHPFETNQVYEILA